MILTILKIIGIVLLVIIALVIILLLLVLLWPVSYRAEGVANDEAKKAKADVTWLLGAVHLALDFDLAREQRLIKTLTIFGIPFEKIQSLLKGKKAGEKDKEARKKKLKKLKEKDPETYRRLYEEAKERRRLEKQKLKEEEEARKAEEARKRAEMKRKRVKAKKRLSLTAESIEGSIRHAVLTALFCLREFFEDLFMLPGLIWHKLSQINAKIRNALTLAVHIAMLLMTPSTMRALRVVLIRLRKLLRHIFPKKCAGHVVFGFEDPFQTGLVLAGVESLYPLWCRNLAVAPDFTRQKLDAEIRLSGRMIISYVVYQALRVWFDKDFKRVKAFLKQEKERTNG